MKKLHVLINSTLLLLTAISTCHAGLINVSEIRISHSTLATTDDFLQISEVVATETGTLNDLALASLGASAIGSNGDWPGGSSADFVIDGIAPDAFPDIYHDNPIGGILSVFLASPSELDEITIFGRTDCCSNRDVYRMELFDSFGNMLFSASDLSAYNSSHSVTVSLPDTALSVIAPNSVLLLAAGLLGMVTSRRTKKS